MDIVKQKQIREWTLFGLVGAMALIANLPDHWLRRIGVQTELLMAVLGLLVVLALFLYVRFFVFLLYILLAIGANIPDQWAEGLGLSREALLGTLIAMVAMSLLNYGAKLLPSGLEAKKRKQNPDAVRALLDAIERGKLSHVKTLLSMDFDLNVLDEKGVSPLMCAARHGQFKVVQMLIKRGASSLLAGPAGKASDFALQHNFPAVNEFLKKVEEVQAAEVASRAAATSQQEPATAT